MEDSQINPKSQRTSNKNPNLSKNYTESTRKSSRRDISKIKDENLTNSAKADPETNQFNTHSILKNSQVSLALPNTLNLPPSAKNGPINDLPSHNKTATPKKKKKPKRKTNPDNELLNGSINPLNKNSTMNKTTKRSIDLVEPSSIKKSDPSLKEKKIKHSSNDSDIYNSSVFSNENPFQSGPDSAKVPSRIKSKPLKAKKSKASKITTIPASKDNFTDIKTDPKPDQNKHLNSIIDHQLKNDLIPENNILGIQQDDISFNVFDSISPPKVLNQNLDLLPTPTPNSNFSSQNSYPNPINAINNPSTPAYPSQKTPSNLISSNGKNNFSVPRSENISQTPSIPTKFSEKSLRSINKTPSNPSRNSINPSYSKTYLRSVPRELLKVNNKFLETPRVKELIEYYERTGNAEALELLYSQSQIMDGREKASSFSANRPSTLSSQISSFNAENYNSIPKSNNLLRNRNSASTHDPFKTNFDNIPTPSNPNVSILTSQKTETSRDDELSKYSLDVDNKKINNDPPKYLFDPEILTSEENKPAKKSTYFSSNFPNINSQSLFEKNLQYLKKFKLSIPFLLTISATLLFYTYCNFVRFKIGFINTRNGEPIIKPDNYELNSGFYKYDSNNRLKISNKSPNELEFSDIIYKIDTFVIDYILGKSQSGLLCPKHATCSVYIPVPHKSAIKIHNLAGKQQIFISKIKYGYLSHDEDEGEEQKVLECDPGYILSSSKFSSRLFPILPTCKPDLDTILKTSMLQNSIVQYLSVHRGNIECSESIMNQIERMIILKNMQEKIQIPDEEKDKSIHESDTGRSSSNIEGGLNGNQKGRKYYSYNGNQESGDLLSENNLASDVRIYGLENKIVYESMFKLVKIPRNEFNHLYSLAINRLASNYGKSVAVVRVEYDKDIDLKKNKKSFSDKLKSKFSGDVKDDGDNGDISNAVESKSVELNCLC
ncbi:hypothetical protein AYI69_g5553 [Smittium culicis]|uniref:Man1/Src1-like C-terminal domain-containing protein n=1 Tax=Smittium culicis TaxID=133412 RepID=A0A1R1Y591_9FUNG|nr:hypothetical protein AYI69_g5553 [Smittium culicis]